MKRTLIAAVLMTFIAGTAHAIDAGTADGTLTVGKQKVALKYSYAHDYRDEVGMGDGPELRIFLSDREVPQSMLAGYDGPMKLDDLARDGKVRGVLIKLDPQKPTAGMSGTILTKPRDPKGSMLFFSGSGGDELTDFKSGGNRVSGKTAYASEGQGSFKDVPPFKFSAAFSAPLFHDEPFTQKLVGPGAAKSPPARALLAYYTALFAGDFDAAKSHATPEQWKRIEEQRAKLGDTSLVGMMKQMMNLSELSREISKVLIRGDTAVIVIKEKGSRSAQSMKQADGVWKVD